MQILRRGVRFCLGMQSLAFLGIIPVAFTVIAALRAQEAAVPAGAYQWVLAFTLMVLLVNLVPTIAWWNLSQGKPSARNWTIAASIPNLLIFLPAIRAWNYLGIALFGCICAVSGAAGLLGLVAFWHAADPKPLASDRLPGDGTSQAKDYIALIANMGILWICYYLATRWSEVQHLKAPGLIGGLLLLHAAIVLTTFGHEMGHFAAGWASGMILRRFQAGPFQWAIRNGRWTFQLRLKEFYGGAVDMVLPTVRNIRGREAFQRMGGPVASLTLASIATTAVLSAKGHSWEPYWAFLSMCAAIAWASFVTNLIPARYSDGAQLVQLISGGEWAHFHIASALVSRGMVTSLRACDFDVTEIHRAADLVTQGKHGLLLRLHACIHYLEVGRIPEALASLHAAEGLYEQDNFENPGDICAEFVFINAFYKRDLTAAEFWWRRIEALGRIDFDADYWRAATALLWLKGERERTELAWTRGNALAQKLPSAGVYDRTRACFVDLRAALDARGQEGPPSAESLEALAAALASPQFISVEA
jgi:hypothetical protein